MNISISFREAYGKKSSGNWVEFNFFQECERLLKCMKRSSVDFPTFFTLILQNWTKTDTQFWKVQSTKGEKSCKNHQVLVTENWKMMIILVILDFPEGLRTSLFCMDFRKSLRQFSQLFLLFCSARSTGVFQWSNARFFLLWVAAVALEH